MSDAASTPTLQVQSPAAVKAMLMTRTHETPIIKPRAVLFDLDDTLINSKALMIPVGKTLKSEMENAAEGTCPDFKVGAPHMDYFERRFSDLPLGSGLWTFYYFERLLEELKKKLPSVLKPDLLDSIFVSKTEGEIPTHIYRFKGALQTLQYLINHDIPVAIVTNSPQELVDISVPQIFPELYKDGEKPKNFVVVGVTEKEKGKPSLDTTTRALAALKIPVLDGKVDKSIYFVGDSHAHDVKLGYQMGMTTILFSDVGMKKDDPKRPSLVPLITDSITSDNAHLQHMLYADDHQDLQKLLDRVIKSSPVPVVSP